MLKILLCVISAFLCISLVSAQTRKMDSKPKSKLQTVDCFGYDWPNEEVPYIISPEEREAWHRLNAEEQKDAFVEDFWQRRDPNPDRLGNEYRDEYYRRILFANDNYSTPRTRGWRTDQGRIYEKYGPPSRVRNETDNGLRTITWTYRSLDDYQNNGSSQAPVQLMFVDECHCGEYTLQASEDDRNILFAPPPEPPVISGLQKAPQVRFKDLEEIVSHHINYRMLPYKVEFSFLPVTKRTAQVRAKVIFTTSQLKWVQGSSGQEAHVQILSRWTTLTQKIAATT